MKLVTQIARSILLLAIAGLMFRSNLHATSVSTCTIEQPVNLGPQSDPARIPLGSVGVTSNYDYGVHWYIGEARACPGGPMRWEGGSELDQNLASVFGITVEAQDSTQITSFPVTLRVKPWKPPGYSPYTKDQVLAATLWCLIHSTNGTPERPLEVRVLAEGSDDKPLEAKYSGKYITSAGNDGKEVPPVKVPGTVIETDIRGIPWVVFPEVTRKNSSTPTTPGMIILEAGGDGDPGWHLLPVWGSGNNKNDFLSLNFRSANMCYSSFHSKGVSNANSFLVDTGCMDFHVEHSEHGDSVTISHPFVRQDTLAADILALVIAAQPNPEKKLSVKICVGDDDVAKYPAFRRAEGWKETKTAPTVYTLECDFVWDPLAKKIAEGSVPLVHLESIDWIAPNLEDEPKEDSATAKLAASVQQRIKDGIHDGSFAPERNMGQYHLAEDGLPREVGKAGYYEALATYSNGTTLPAMLQDDPVKTGDDQLDQYHRSGWAFGLSLCQTIEKQVRQEMDGKTLKKDE